ncbi:MAG: FeoA family protein [Candidatus Omnitrophota bacterium]|jgi:Fe2+ transport system protein FeoA
MKPAVIIPLTKLEPHKKAKISHIKTEDNATLQRIIAIGALPDADIVLIQKFPSFVFQIHKSQFAVDKELASCIYVRAV